MPDTQEVPKLAIQFNDIRCPVCRRSIFVTHKEPAGVLVPVFCQCGWSGQAEVFTRQESRWSV